MGTIVYALCAAASCLCATMLVRGFRRSHMRLLLWSGICFSLLALSNIILFIDLVVTGPEIDLSFYRNLFMFFGGISMLFGLIWETV